VLNLKPIRTVYLAGGIAGLSDNNVNDWRKEAARLFSNFDIEVLSPMDKPSISSPHVFYREDLRDVARADAVLCEYIHRFRNYTGTTSELMYASMMNKPIATFVGRVGDDSWQIECPHCFSVVKKEKGEVSWWLTRLSDVVVADMGDAIDYIISLNYKGQIKPYMELN